MNSSRPHPPNLGQNWIVVGLVICVTLLICLLGMSVVSDTSRPAPTLADQVNPAPHPND